MIVIRQLINHHDFRLRMVAIHHAWALMYLREHNYESASVQFMAARNMLDEARGIRDV